MKTREQIIEDYFRARGATVSKDPHSSIGPYYWCWPDGSGIPMDGHEAFYGQESAGEYLACHFPLNRDFDLFREHVIEVMAGLDFFPVFLPPDSRRKLDQHFSWQHLGEKKGSDWVLIKDNCWTLAAIEAATEVLNAER